MSRRNRKERTEQKEQDERDEQSKAEPIQMPEAARDEVRNMRRGVNTLIAQMTAFVNGVGMTLGTPKGWVFDQDAEVFRPEKPGDKGPKGMKNPAGMPEKEKPDEPGKQVL